MIRDTLSVDAALLANPDDAFAWRRLAVEAGLAFEAVEPGAPPALDLAAVEPAGLFGNRGHQLEGLLRLEVRDERRPRHALGLRRRELGEGRIAADEVMQVLGTLRDRGEHLRETRRVAAPGDFSTRVRER